jgi:hypothetical protein
MLLTLIKSFASSLFFSLSLLWPASNYQRRLMALLCGLMKMTLLLWQFESLHIQ